MISILVIDISLYFHSSFFWITSDFSIHLKHFTSELQMTITFLFVNENIKCGYAFSLLECDDILVPKLLGFAEKFSFLNFQHLLFQ